MLLNFLFSLCFTEPKLRLLHQEMIPKIPATMDILLPCQSSVIFTFDAVTCLF